MLQFPRLASVHQTVSFAPENKNKNTKCFSSNGEQHSCSVSLHAESLRPTPLWCAHFSDIYVIISLFMSLGAQQDLASPLCPAVFRFRPVGSGHSLTVPRHKQHLVPVQSLCSACSLLIYGIALVSLKSLFVFRHCPVLYTHCLVV